MIQREGHQVKYYIDSKKLQDVFDGIVPKTSDWRKELGWVGKKGLIVFDDNGYGKVQDSLRKDGYCVFGGCEMADKLENNREYTQEIFRKYGIKSKPLKSFKSVKEAVRYVEKHPNKWVLKREGDNSKFVSYAGERKDGKDVLEILKKHAKDKKLCDQPISVQEKQEGIEIGVGRYFNGEKFIGPIEINLEHPHLFAGDIGPFTDEMGTVAWYTDEESKIYKQTLGRLEDFLREIDYRGDMGVNCIVNGKSMTALETTARLGCPIVHLHSVLHKSGWGEFMKSIANKEDFNLKWRKEIGVVFSVSVPPFPFEQHFLTDVCTGLTVHMDKVTEREKEHIHLDEVAYDKRGKRVYISHQTDGFVLYVTGIGKDIQQARVKALKIIDKILIPKMFYRRDIGEKFERSDYQKLKKWGWI